MRQEDLYLRSINLILLLWTGLSMGACTPKKDGTNRDSLAASIDSSACSSERFAPVVLAGGGEEGTLEEVGSWSAEAFEPLTAVRDLDGDGTVRGVVLSGSGQNDTFYASYFEGLAAACGRNVVMSSFDMPKGGRFESAFLESLRNAIQKAEFVFFKGGDQSVYYNQLTKEGLVDSLRAVRKRGGGLGGTSAGAMSLAGHAFVSGWDLTSSEVLSDSDSLRLQSVEGSPSPTSGLRSDFISAVSDAIVDTHFVARGRTARLVGLIALAHEHNRNRRVTGIGIDIQTALVVDGQKATVVGDGTVTIIDGTMARKLSRGRGLPLHYENLRLHRLTKGSTFVWNKEGLIVPDTKDFRPLAYGDVKTRVSFSGAIDGGNEQDTSFFENHAYWKGKELRLIYDRGCSTCVRGFTGFTLALPSRDAAEKEEGVVGMLAFTKGPFGILSYPGSVLSFPKRSLRIDASQRKETRRSSVLLFERTQNTLFKRSKQPSAWIPSLQMHDVIDLLLDVLSPGTTWELP